jgi:hypothetical protein
LRRYPANNHNARRWFYYNDQQYHHNDQQYHHNDQQYHHNNQQYYYYNDQQYYYNYYSCTYYVLLLRLFRRCCRLSRHTDSRTGHRWHDLCKRIPRHA